MISLLFPTDPERAHAGWRWTLPRFILGAALALAFQGDLGAQTVMNLASAKVMSCAGTVNIVPKSGASTPAYVGATMQPGEKLQVGANGLAELDLPGAGAARVESGSEVKLPEATGATPPQESLEMLKGRLFLNIDEKKLKKRDKREFRLKTPATVLAVKGTRFFAFASATGDTLGVHEGMVEAYEPVSKQSRHLEAGSAVDASLGKLSAARALRPVEEACGFIYPGAPVPGWVVPIGDGNRCLTIGFIQTGSGDRFYRFKDPQNGEGLWKEDRSGKREVVFQCRDAGMPPHIQHILAGPDDTLFVASDGPNNPYDGVSKVSGKKVRLVSHRSIWLSQLDPKAWEHGALLSFLRKKDGAIDLDDIYFQSHIGLYRKTSITRKQAGPAVLAYPGLKPLGFTMVSPNDIYLVRSVSKPDAVIEHVQHPPDQQEPTTIAQLPIFPLGIDIITMGVWPLDEKPKPRP